MVWPGATLTHTIRVTNSDFITLNAAITDILPARVTPNGVPVWSPTTIITPGGIWTQEVVVAVNPDYEGSLINVVQVSSKEGATDSYTAPAMAEWLY